MLDPKFKQKWLAALTDGSFKRATGCLRRPIGYCCLGVAADLLGVEWTPDSIDVNGFTAKFPGYNSTTAYIPPEILGVPLNYQQRLANLNDTDGIDEKYPQSVIDFITKKL